MGEGAPSHRWEPLALLLGAGGCIGLIFPLAKIAGGVGLSPLTYAALSALGASCVLAAVARAAGERLPLSQPALAYAIVAGQLTFAIPFGALIAVIPRIGSGIPAIFQSLAPLVTLAIVAAIGFEASSRMRLAGLAIGFAGALLVLVNRDAAAMADGAPWYWYAAALVTPLALAVGNVYRSTHWPAGHSPLPLAVLTLAAAAAGLAALALLLSSFGLIGPLTAGLAAGWPLILVQSLLTGLGYALFFRLQKVGGPVYLSQISYVNTAVGLLVAVLALGERLPPASWAAVVLIVVGIILVTVAAKNA